MACPIFAQFDGTGFYRIKNKGAAKRYLSVVNNKVDDTNKNVDVTAAASFIDVQVYALGTIKDPVTDPGSILYMTGKTLSAAGAKDKSIQVSIQAQGMNTDKLTKNQKLQIINDTYLFAEYQGVSLYMSDTYESYLANQDMNACIISGKTRRELSKDYATWEVIKVDNTNEYLGVKPELSLGGKYYTTMYTSFAYDLSEGMKAYYIDTYKCGNYIDNPIAQLKEISGRIPAATPVILECSSTDPKVNKLLPATGKGTAIKDNELTGVYFSYVKLTPKGVENTVATLGAQLKNVVSYDASTMRILGVADGHLALVPATDSDLHVTNLGKYLPANKAYFQMEAEEAPGTAGKSLKVLAPADYEDALTGISGVKAQAPAKGGVYTLGGVRVSEGSTEGLPKGIYIADGKKIIVR